MIVGNVNELTLRKHTVDKYVANFVSHSCYLSQVEPAKVEDAWQDESWAEAMHDELHQFQRNDVWTLVLMPGLNLNGVEKLPTPSSRPLIQPPIMATVPARVGPCWKAPFNMMMVVWFAQGFECSLSQWRRVFVYPLALWQESGPNFKGLPKVSGVAINH